MCKFDKKNVAFYEKVASIPRLFNPGPEISPAIVRELKLFSVLWGYGHVGIKIQKDLNWINNIG